MKTVTFLTWTINLQKKLGQFSLNFTVISPDLFITRSLNIAFVFSSKFSMGYAFC